eukprot:XP_002599828.1 hypothetical protein BRAFLDRAFT_70297 [Branchiostoma floridae]
MDDHRLPKILLYGELAEGKRHVGRPKLRYKDSLKATLKDFSIPVDSWELAASDRSQWRRLVHQGAGIAEKRRTALAVSRRETRKARKADPPTQPPPGLQCNVCGRCFRARIGLISHARTHKGD